MGTKHCGKRRNCSWRAISPFFTVFSKDLYSRHVKSSDCLGKDLNVWAISYWLLFVRHIQCSLDLSLILWSEGETATCQILDIGNFLKLHATVRIFTTRCECSQITANKRPLDGLRVMADSISCRVRWQGTWKLVHGCGESCRPEPKARWRHDSPKPWTRYFLLTLYTYSIYLPTCNMLSFIY